VYSFKKLILTPNPTTKPVSKSLRLITWPKHQYDGLSTHLTISIQNSIHTN
jgi:hypothetical protein